MALSYLDRAWRDGFWQREPVSACPAYMDAYAAGQRRGDRTRARLVACSQPANASPALSGLVSDPPCVAGRGEADLPPSDTPEGS